MEFIPDNELFLNEKNDILGTKIYSNLLYELILNKKDINPLTIGLFGSWGTGKSSIIKTLKETIEKNSKTIKIMIYDSWKYSKDAFRRSFILELKNKFNLESKEELEEFYKDKTEEIKGKTGISSNWWIYSLLIILPLLLINLESVFIKKSIQLTPIIISLLFSGIATFITKTFLNYKISITKPKVFSPEQFEQIFKEAIDELVGKRSIIKWIREFLKFEDKVSKIVIIFDNIDRCHPELAQELLLTIKNFLEHEKCIFIIPIDNESIKKHLRFFKNNEDIEIIESEEFLRKFFNTTIRIKKFTNQDLFHFTEELIKKYELGFSSKISSIVSQEFSKNPRRIIQFLNNLYYEKLVAIHQEKNNLIQKGSITNNIEFLAKTQIIKEEWPKLYELINANYNILNEINKDIIEDNFVKKDYFFISKSNDKLKLSENQYLFFRRTIPIQERNVELFFRIKDFEKDIPDDLIVDIMSYNWENIKKYLTDNTIEIKKTWEIIFKKLDEAVVKRNLLETDGYSLINLIFIIINDKEYEKEFINIYKDLEPYINDKNFQKIISKFQPRLLMEFSKKLSDKHHNYLRDRILSFIDSTSKSEIPNKELLYKFIDEYMKSYINDDQSLLKIKNFFSNMLIDDITHLKKYDNQLEKVNIVKNLVNDSLINKIIDIINNKPEQDIITFINTVKKADILLDDHEKNYITKINSNILTNDYDQLNFWFKALKGHIINCNDNTILNNLFTNLENRYNFLYTRFYQQNERNEIQLECNVNFLNLLSEYYLSISDLNHNSITYLNNYFQHNESRELFLYVNSIYKEIIEHADVYNWPFAELVISRFNNLPTFDDRKNISQTILLMLKRTKEEEEETIGLSLPQIEKAIDQFFEYHYSSIDEESKEAEKWLLELLTYKNIKTYVENKIKSFEDIEQQKKIMKVISKIRDDDIKQTSIYNIIKSSIINGEIKTDISLIIDNFGQNGEKYIKNSLLGIIEEISTEDIDNYKKILEKVINLQKFLNNEDMNQIIDKLIPLISSDKKGLQKYAINRLNQIDYIPSEKHALLKQLINRIEFKKEEDQMQIKVIKSKLRKRTKRHQKG